VTSQKSDQPVNQANQHATQPVNQQPTTGTTPQDTQQTTPKVETQPSNQAPKQTVPNQANQQIVPRQANHQIVPSYVNQPTVNPPASFPQPLSSQPQDSTTKPQSKTPTEVRTVVAKNKKFQVQVLQEPPDGSVTDLPIAPVQPVNTNVPQDTKVSPVQEVAAPIGASETNVQARTTQQSVKSNIKTSTENTNEETSSLLTTKPGIEASGHTTVTQGTDNAQNTSPDVAAIAQSAQTRTGSPTQQPQVTLTPRPESPVVAQPTQSVGTQGASLPTNGAQQTTETQTSLGQEPKVEASATTETRDFLHENIRVQSPMSSHPPIYIPIAPAEKPSENNTSSQTANDPVSAKTQNSQKSIDNEKAIKHDEIIALTSSIETQTSFDKNTFQELSKKATERKTIEKSLSDEQALDDSDGSVCSEKSYSRQSSDSYSSYDVDKNISLLQAKMDTEHWLNQVIVCLDCTCNIGKFWTA
jgi:hypothetical protein